MKTVIFDGQAEADKREAALRDKVRDAGLVARLGTVVFGEDESSQLYTRLKFEAAVRVGLAFDRVDVSVKEAQPDLVKVVEGMSARADIQGVMIQKPGKSGWSRVTGNESASFNTWWHALTEAIAVTKDVDGLSPENLRLVEVGSWRVLPATAKAVLSILEQAKGLPAGILVVPGTGRPVAGLNAVVVGQSEIVGLPVAAVLRHHGAIVEVAGSKTEHLGDLIRLGEVVVSATGIPGLITGEMVREGAVVIDVGSPQGDVRFNEVAPKASFITPAPGGVGPMTVVSLLENLFNLASQ